MICNERNGKIHDESGLLMDWVCETLSFTIKRDMLNFFLSHLEGKWLEWFEKKKKLKVIDSEGRIMIFS